MPRETSSFAISTGLKQRLIKAGFDDDDCFRNATPLSLSKEANISVEEALQVIKIAKGQDESLKAKQISAFALAQKESERCGIVTFSQKIDAMLGDGVSIGKITEICGVPGIGKTQLSMQLCVDATIPECFGGVEGQAVYIDTEGSFVPKRAAQIAQAAVDHCKFVATSTQDPGMLEKLKTYDAGHVMKSIVYLRCKSCFELASMTYQLPEFIAKRCTKVKLIVVDSFAFHFRYDWNSDMSNRTRVMSSLAQQFVKMASDLEAAVVLINQMTTKIDGPESKLIPALGESWSHVPSNRVLLFWRGSQRYANLFKSSSRKEGTVPYCVTADGIRDGDDQTAPIEEPATKRMRSSI